MYSTSEPSPPNARSSLREPDSHHQQQEETSTTTFFRGKEAITFIDTSLTFVEILQKRLASHISFSQWALTPANEAQVEKLERLLEYNEVTVSKIQIYLQEIEDFYELTDELPSDSKLFIVLQMAIVYTVLAFISLIDSSGLLLPMPAAAGILQEEVGGDKCGDHHQQHPQQKHLYYLELLRNTWKVVVLIISPQNCRVTTAIEEEEASPPPQQQHQASQ